MIGRRNWQRLFARRYLIREMTSRVEVWRATSTSDGAGGATTSFARQTTTPGWVEPPSESARVYAEKMGTTATAVVNLPWDVVVLPDDELRVDTRRLRLIGTDTGSSDPLVQRVVVSEIA